MIDLILGLFIAATIALIPFFAFLMVITIAALFRSLKQRPASIPVMSRFLIVIPAHNEEGAIGATVRSSLALDYPRDLFSVFVIADNCTDATARDAAEAGATVFERDAPDLRSKGHALEYFFTEIPEGRTDSGYDAVVLIDADTVVDPLLLKVFNRALGEGKDWIQGYYTVRNPDASWRTRMMTYAFSLTNGVWMVGLDRLGLSVGLKGNGMCFSAKGLQRFPWKAYGLVEDMEFAWMLRTRGERVHFLPEARVYGEMVSQGGEAAASQRKRWEAGRRSLTGKFAGPLFRSQFLKPYRKTFYLLDLYFPPLATLALALLGVVTIHAIALFSSRFSPLSHTLIPIHAVMIGFLALYALSPIMVIGLPVRYLASLFRVPYYIFWKLVKASGKKPVKWVRTPRENEASTLEQEG